MNFEIRTFFKTLLFLFTLSSTVFGDGGSSVVERKFVNANIRINNDNELFLYLASWLHLPAGALYYSIGVFLTIFFILGCINLIYTIGNGLLIYYNMPEDKCDEFEIEPVSLLSVIYEE